MNLTSSYNWNKICHHAFETIDLFLLKIFLADSLKWLKNNGVKYD